MLLKDKSHGELIEVVTMTDLVDPFHSELVGRYQHGEEVQDSETFSKNDLVFLSGEDLPKCWKDPHYRDHELQH